MAIDEWDKYQRQFAVKIADIESWETYDASPFQKQLLLQSRGGLSDTSPVNGRVAVSPQSRALPSALIIFLKPARENKASRAAGGP